MAKRKGIEDKIEPEFGSETNLTKKKDKRLLTLFIALFPSILMVGEMDNLHGLVYRVLLFFYQLVILKNLVDDYYLG